MIGTVLSYKAEYGCIMIEYITKEWTCLYTPFIM